MSVVPESKSHAKVRAALPGEPAGRPATPSALFSSFTRREFLVVAGVAGLASLPGCGGSNGQPNSVLAYRLSGRGRRISNAAKTHNANNFFASPQAAEAGRAHPGDTSRVVSVVVSAAFFAVLFGAGNQRADLRQVL